MNLDTFLTALASLQRRLPTTVTIAANGAEEVPQSEVAVLLSRCATTSAGDTDAWHVLCSCLLQGGAVVDDGGSSSGGGGGVRQPLQSARCWEMYALGALLLKDLLQAPAADDARAAALTRLALASVPGLLAHSEPRLRKLCAQLVFLLAQVRGWSATKPHALVWSDSPISAPPAPTSGRSIAFPGTRGAGGAARPRGAIRQYGRGVAGPRAGGFPALCHVPAHQPRHRCKAEGSDTLLAPPCTPQPFNVSPVPLSTGARAYART